MKKYCILFLFFALIPSIFADISIQTNQPVYNLGNKIQASASVIYSSDFEGLFKLTISCPEQRLQYFTTPISLEGNSRTALQVPELTSSSSMLGNCNIIGELATNNNLPLAQGNSNPFEVTYNLIVLPVNEKITSLPGHEIRITGIVNEANGNNVLKATVKVELDGNTHPAEATDGKFNLAIALPNSIKSGKHEIEITVSDSKNNMGKATVELHVTAVPSYIKTELSDDSIDPGTRIGIISSLYDQADELINTTLELELASGDEKVFTKQIPSNEKIDYEFSQYAKPGLYVLTSTYQNLKVTSHVNVSSVRNVKIKYENESVFIENTGNVPFIDQLTFIIQNQLKKYAVSKDIEIQPGKLLSVDLSREVPQGIYNVMVPLKEAIDEAQEAANASLESEKLLASGVAISDNRPAYKKIGSGISSVSGSLVGADGLLTKHPLVGPAILLSIISLLAFKYGRKPLMGILKRKKKDEEKKE